MNDADVIRLVAELDEIATAIELLVDGSAEDHGPLGVLFRLGKAERRDLQRLLDRLRAFTRET